MEAQAALARGAAAPGQLDDADVLSHGRHNQSTLLLAAIDCHSLGIHTVILLPLLSFLSHTKIRDSVALVG